MKDIAADLARIVAPRERCKHGVGPNQWCQRCEDEMLATLDQQEELLALRSGAPIWE